MLAMPFQILGWWLRSVLTIAALCGGIALILNARSSELRIEERHDSATVVAPPQPVKSEPKASEGKPIKIWRWNIGWNRDTAMLGGGILILAWSLAGGWFSGVLLRPHDPDFPNTDSSGVVTRVTRPDGSQLHVERYGKADGIPLILTHGWGLDCREWLCVRKELENRFDIIVWDLPGLGRSKGPNNDDWSLEKLAADLHAILQVAPDRPVILAGHSIGGMIILTFCRLFPDMQSRRLAGIVLGQTTYTNPVETTFMASFYRMIQKPVLEPLCHLMIALAPLAWLMNWWSYCNGSVHRTNHKKFFSGSESREELKFISHYAVRSWPAVVARGLLGMFRFDAGSVLRNISVPTVVIGGARDSTCLPQASETMVDRIPGARGVSFKNAEHGGIFEFHQQFAEAIHELVSTSLSTLDGSDEDGAVTNRLTGR